MTVYFETPAVRAARTTSSTAIQSAVRTRCCRSQRSLDERVVLECGAVLIAFNRTTLVP